MTDEPIVFLKNSTLSTPNRFGANELISIPRQVLNPDTGAFEFAETLERTLTFGDWNEQDVSLSESYTAQMPGLLALNWASTEAISGVIPSQASYWNSFLRISGWTQTRPDSINFFDISQDNDWWFLQAAKFADATSTENPQADFASTWNLYFEADAEDERIELVSKINKVDEFFSVLGFF